MNRAATLLALLSSAKAQYVFTEAPDSITWSDARAACISAGGDLASIHSDDDNAAALALTGDARGAWIGLNDKTTPDTFVWSDGTPVDYRNWASGEPNNSGGNEDSVALYHVATWNDYSDDTTAVHGYLCSFGTGGTQSQINVGDVVDGSITVGGTAAYILTLTEGQTVTIEVVLGTLRDSTLTIFAPGGSDQLAFNDDAGGSLASILDFTAPYGGDFVLSVAGYANANAGSFTIAVQSQNDPCGEAGTHINTASGDILYSNSYDNGAVCTWYLDCGVGAIIELEIESMDTEHNFDYVSIYDGDSADATRLAHLSGNMNQISGDEYQVSSGSTMTVQFTSDGSVTRGGFDASYFCNYDNAPTDTPNAEGFAYHNVPGGITWGDAHAACQSAGSELASIHTAAMNDAALSISAANGACWIGFNDQAQEGSWVWSDGSGVNYMNWEPGEPNDLNGEDAAAIYATGTWNDYAEDGSTGVVEGYICNHVGGGGNIQPTGGTQGSILAGGQPVDYNLAATGGTTYDIEVVLGTLSDSTVAVLDTSGTQLAFDDDGGDGLGSLISWTAPYTGTFTVRVAPYSTSQSGSFTVQFGAGDDPCGAAGVTLSRGTGDIFFSNAYDNGAQCTWHINCPNAQQHVVLTFNQFQTEANYDFVDVYDGSSAGFGAQRLAHESGNTNPAAQTSTSSSMTVQFTSDGSVTGQGFDASYRCRNAH